MKIGISRLSRSFEESREVFEAAERYGFQGVQMKPNQYNFCLGDVSVFEQAYGTLASLARGGLIVYPGGDPETWPEKVLPLIPFAAAIGAEQICVVGAVDRSDTSGRRFRYVASVLRKIGVEARKQGTSISIHNHANCLVETKRDLERLFKHLDPQVCGLTLDTAHAAKAGIADIPEVIRRFEAHLNNVHLKDFSEDGAFCPLGLGTVDLATILDTLKEIGYRHWLVVDEESQGYSTEEAYRISMTFLKAHAIVP